MKHIFLDKEVEIREFTIRQADEVQELLLGDSDIASMGDKATVSLKSFKSSQYLAVEYGTKDKKITVDYLLDLPASKAPEVQDLYDAIMSINGQQA